ncbi:hypothetical protein PV721_24650 [Streptomyces sp. MB09-01]|uniref:hypothetical protein n=1 Tax=Streptomyces sp. MB09-01 TaxID=3028666 RepID=UPI0029AE55BD|nr:hypothetical protein [Streptomyces sp. MB09-01]MDX3537503.1 hypothetical protein [Streptomyces sp. MB09-01]
MTPERPPEEAYDVILQLGGVVILATAVAVMAVRQRLVLLGRIAPLSMRARDDAGREPGRRP